MDTKRVKPRVIFEESPDIIVKIKACAEHKGLSVSDIIRLAVREFLENHGFAR